MAPQPVLGTDPTALWTQLQPDKGSIRGWKKKNKYVERNIHSKFATAEKGDVVGQDIEPSFAHDPNKDLVDLVMESVFRCSAKHFGGTGLSLFRPTAVTATGYTVAANGNIAANLLFYGRGFNNANDGLKKSSAGSTNNEIKTGGTVVTAGPLTNQTLDLVGIEASAAADLQIDANGDLTSATLDFRTLGVQVGMWLILPTPAQALAMGNAAYALALYAGRARIKAIDQVNGRKLTLERRTWVQAGADVAAGKTLRVFFTSRFYQNYALDDANYKKAILYAEVELPNAGPDNAVRFIYAKACAVGTFELDAPLESKITATLSFIGIDATLPTTNANRVGGVGAVVGDSPVKAYAPLAYHLFDTANDVREIRLCDSAGKLLAEITAWKLTVNNNVKARKAQGSAAALGHIYGQHDRMAHVTGYFQNSDMLDAATTNRDLTWDAYMQNDQFAQLWDMPYCAFRNEDLAIASNEPVMIEGDVIAFRSDADNIELSLSVFGYVP